MYLLLVSLRAGSHLGHTRDRELQEAKIESDPAERSLRRIAFDIRSLQLAIARVPQM